MHIYIDGVRMDTDERSSVCLTLAVVSASDPEKNRTGYSHPVILPVTANNRKVMGACDQINSAGIFNHRHHTARIEKQGCVVMEGTAVLLSCTADDGPADGQYYRIELIGGAKLWADHAANTMLRALPVEFEETLSAATLSQSWTWDKPIRFLPVQRDGFQVENHSANLVRPAKILSFEDYHPFLNLKKILDRIFEESGYRLRSEFMESDFFGKLHISGNYPSGSADAVKSRMDFRAGRFDTASATADSLGRVYADPYYSFSTVGNIVDTADPEEACGGSVVSGVYDRGGCFVRYDERVAFVPLFEVDAAFEYRIFYTTDYHIKDRWELTGFDTIYLGDGQSHKFSLANRNADRREELRRLQTYVIIVFGHVHGDAYRFAYDQIAGQVRTEYIADEFSARTFTVTVNSELEVADAKLYIRDGSGNYSLYGQDWALYDGYVGESGRMEVELRVRSSAERILPSAPKFFDGIYFGGAKQGMELTLGSRTTLRPVFTLYPTIGTRVTFEEVAAHRVTCLELIKSVKHLFNLKFYTDELSKTVYAEPPQGFYEAGPATDWTPLIDHSRPIVIREPAEKTYSTLSYCYQSGDGAVTRQNLSKGETLGKWSVRILNNLARTGEQTVENPMFTASLNRSEDYPDAADASLLQAGNRSLTENDDLEDLNFLPKIVCYEGLRELPAGQRWGWPATDSRYPYLAFHHTGADNTATGDVEPFTLCFEDRNSLQSLHVYRDHEIARLRAGKRIEVYMDLRPHHLEPFVRPCAATVDFRGLFRLRINGETAFYRLEEISGYSPSGDSTTKCVFVMEYPLA